MACEFNFKAFVKLEAFLFTVMDMTKILPFKKPRAKAKGLCQHGHHKWVIQNSRPFDSQKGQLVTLFICERCGQSKTKGM